MMDKGTVIADRYEVLSHVGQGGMQDVYRAFDKVTGQIVALKTPQTGQGHHSFKKSALISAKINHHNVAKTLDYIEESKSVYLVEEFVDGETLEQKCINKYGLIDPHLGARALHHLAKGVAASHHAGVVHRDLKPSNVMAPPGVNLHTLKITDFGIATLAAEVFDEAAKAGDITRSASGTIKGALPYMAPEMMFKKPGAHPGKAADVWSVGAMMFRLLTGEYPFGVYLEAAVNVKAGNRAPWPAFMTANPQFAPLAKELQELIDTCFHANPDDRPTADELVSRCETLCYLAIDREEGTVNNFIQHGYTGFIAMASHPNVFFHKDSVYGPVTGASTPPIGTSVSFSSFPGHPKNRAHPVVALKENH